MQNHARTKWGYSMRSGAVGQGHSTGRLRGAPTYRGLLAVLPRLLAELAAMSSEAVPVQLDDGDAQGCLSAVTPARGGGT